MTVVGEIVRFSKTNKSCKYGAAQLMYRPLLAIYQSRLSIPLLKVKDKVMMSLVPSLNILVINKENSIIIFAELRMFF